MRYASLSTALLAARHALGPFGYVRFRTQVIATLPSTVMAAAQRLKLNAVVITIVMYSMLAIGMIALVAYPTTR
jgi:hypothetical protein